MLSTKSSTFAVAALAGAVLVRAQEPLASQHFTWGSLPYQADTTNGERGPQYGYNICNSTTEGPESRCQTAIINSIEDFCLWGPPEPNSEIGTTEGEAVAWCTQPGHGTRVIPKGTFTGIQFVRTPDYVQVTGRINQANINIAAEDSGGEMDPHGADQRGNPMGGLLFSNAYAASGGDPNNYIQVVEWHNFMGSGEFCLKACDPSRPNAARLCEHIYDRIGCHYNAPAKYEEGTFESCLGDTQDPPGIYTGADGVITTYQQPPEDLGPIQVIPYDPKIPASSQCTPYDINTLFANAPAAPSGASTSSASRPTNTRSTTTNTRRTTTRTGSSDSESATQTGNGSNGGFRNAEVALGGLFAVAGAMVAMF